MQWLWRYSHSSKNYAAMNYQILWSTWPVSPQPLHLQKSCQLKNFYIYNYPQFVSTNLFSSCNGSRVTGAGMQKTDFWGDFLRVNLGWFWYSNKAKHWKLIFCDLKGLYKGNSKMKYQTDPRPSHFSPQGGPHGFSLKNRTFCYIKNEGPRFSP